MAAWWITEAIPIPATALIPLVAFPLLGILPADIVARQYGHHLVFLFLGGFILAQAIQKCCLHRRIALWTVNGIGRSPSRIILGFMVATGFLSMWISNTATTLMMIPVALGIISRAEERNCDPGSTRNFSCALLLGIAYSANIGGIATLIGTPPNTVFASQFEKFFSSCGAPEITFFRWVTVGLPVVLCFLPLVWLLLTRVFFPVRGDFSLGSRDHIREELDEMGKMSRAEGLTLAVFLTTAFLWIFLKDIPITSRITIPGWSNLLGVDQMVRDATVAIAMAIVLFLVPVDLKKREFLMDWEWARKIPWGLLLLFGGGIALATGFAESGLSESIGRQVKAFQGLHPIFLVASLCLIMTFLTEITSNTATANIMMPILASTSVGMGIDPLLMMIPAVLSISCAFMLPVATPPNAIIFSSGYLTVPTMARTGLFINLLGVVLVTTIIFLVAVPVLGIDPSALPSWAAPIGP